ncbi:hypothetical protein, partial [Staphylococcus aureus]|uniref:hypothetical protein n=1 Tax=Staphylococcus aureus TaxID=1280 RepID=UPI003D0C1352
ALLKGIEGAVTAINAIDQSFRAMLARRSTKGLLILPTLEEVSRYSIKARQASDNFDPYYAFQHADELIERQNRILRRRELRMRNRLSM